MRRAQRINQSKKMDSIILWYNPIKGEFEFPISIRTKKMLSPPRTKDCIERVLCALFNPNPTKSIKIGTKV